MHTRIVLIILGCVWVSVAMGAPRKVRVNDLDLARSMVAQGARLVAEYDHFHVLETELESSDLAGAEFVDEYDVIELNTGGLNTRAPAVQALRRPVSGFAGKRLHLVHFAGPIKPEWQAALEQNGAQVVCYVPQNAYLIYGDAPALARVHSWAATAGFVQWDAEYAEEYKIHPRARPFDAQGNPQGPPTNAFAVQLLEDAEANTFTLGLIDQLRAGPVQRQFRTAHYLNVIVRLPAGRLNEIAACADVISIHPYVEPRKRDERQNQIVAGNLTGSGPSAPGYLAWLTGKGFTQAQFTASGFAVDVTDSGLDNGTTAPGHFGLYALGDPALASRVIYNRLEGSPHPGSTLQGCDGHGTINSHIVAGYNNRAAGFPHTDSAGYRYGLGICPFVKVGSSVIFDPDTFTNPDYADLQSRAYQDGARISANSWGADVAGDYNVDSQAYDALVRDAQPAGSAFVTAGNQQMIIVFSAGNAGPGGGSVGSPGTGKNLITVGAAENVRSMTVANGGNDASGNDGCATPDNEANSANDIVGFSSRGPCQDGRQKPEIVAPGTHITGGVAQAGSPNTNGTGTAIACFDGTGVCALLGHGTPGDPDNFFPLSQQFYTESSGTSHSAPAVSGACALLRQYFINNALTPPSPAMTKAFLLNAARYLNGVGANDNLWSPSQGMGELNLGFAFDGVSRVLRDQLAPDKFTATGQTRSFSGGIADPTKPFRVTIAWTDAPGSTTGNAYNNDLNLTVTVGGVTYKGNVFSGAFSVPGGVADNRNNVESVFLPAGLTGTFVVTVTAANINSDGVPNESPSLDQDFGLVIYNATEAPVPVLLFDSSNTTAESCPPANGAIDAGETVTVAIALKNTGLVSTTNLVATLLPTNGVALPNSPQNYGAIPVGGSVTQSFTFTAVGLCGGTIQTVLQLQDGALNPGTLTKTFSLGATILNTRSATNSTAIDIPDTGKSGPGSPYPSTITVSGVTGTVSKVTVTLIGVQHSFPDDMDILLVGPTGQKVMLMSDAGGEVDTSGVTLTFADDALTALPDATLITSGTYLPTDFDTSSDAFPAPAPAGPYATGLSVFNGLNANGTWSLYTRDDVFWAGTQNTGGADQGWRISVSTSSNICCFGSANTPPSISSIANVTTNENAAAGPVPFTIGDAETAASALSLAGNSSNTNLVPNAGIVFGGSGSNRTVTLLPAANRFGTATITVTVSDGAASATNSLLATFVDVNQTPTLAAIADRTNSELTAITFTNSATDPDIPPQLLSYSLSNAPAGATINATNGVFNWTPDEVQGPGVYVITVLVTDNGSPPMSDTIEFTLAVDEVNVAPTLAAIPGRTVHAGTAVTFTNSAADPDLPANALAFNLEPGAPSGASVNSSNGVFTWLTHPSDLNTTNPITVRVTDNGVPTLSNTQSFVVTVVSVPIQSISLSNAVAILNWSAIPGQTYRVQFSDDLLNANWTNLLPDVTAVGTNASKADPTLSTERRFYRVLVRP